MQSVTGKNKPFFYFFGFVIISIPAFIYFFNVWTYAINIPSNDDYGAILDFLCKYKGAQGFDKFSLLFSQHNEHRILSSRIFYVLYYNISGAINFRHIIFAGNLQLLLVFCVLLVFIKRCLPGHWFLASLVASLCLFDLSNWENADFAMAGMANYSVFLWFVLSLLFYTLPGRMYLFAAVLCQVVCIYSNGNGIVAAGIIMLFNVLSGKRAGMALSSGVFLVGAPLYFLHYVSPATGHPATDIIKISSYYLRLAGAHIIFESERSAIASGIVTMALFAAFFPFGKKMRIKPDILPLACISCFLVLSMVVNALFRSNLPGISPASSRYLIYPHFLIALIFIFALYRFRYKRAALPSAVLITLVMLQPYKLNYIWGSDCLPALRRNLQSTDYYYPDKEWAKKTAEDACRLKIYCIQDFR